MTAKNQPQAAPDRKYVPMNAGLVDLLEREAKRRNVPFGDFLDKVAAAGFVELESAAAKALESGRTGSAAGRPARLSASRRHV